MNNRKPNLQSFPVAGVWAHPFIFPIHPPNGYQHCHHAWHQGRGGNLWPSISPCKVQPTCKGALAARGLFKPSRWSQVLPASCTAGLSSPWECCIFQQFLLVSTGGCGTGNARLAWRGAASSCKHLGLVKHESQSGNLSQE